MARQTRQSRTQGRSQTGRGASAGDGEAPVQGGDRAASASNVPEFTISELSGAIKRALEDGFGFVRLRGEISGYRGPHASGHCYFALKDEKAKIDAVVWRGVFSKLKVAPEEGMEVVAQGRVTSYPGASKYQIVIETLEPAGVGALMAILEERRKAFAAEGVFDEDRKKPIPFLPAVVGIVTSPTGAVIRDMLAGFNERYPTRVVLWPVRVQGETSGLEVAAAVRGFNALPPRGSGHPVPKPDILIVARGGGSLEDLWGFNDEAVVRAVADSDLPVISAVGHETDWTLIDLVADARAPTPTKAAEWAVPKHSELIQQNADLTARLRTSITRVTEAARSHLKAATRGLPRPENLLGPSRQSFDNLERRLPLALIANTRAHLGQLREVSARLTPGLLRARLSVGDDRLRTAAGRGREAFLRIAGDRRRRLDRVAGRLSPSSLRLRAASYRERVAVAGGRAAMAFKGRVAAERRALEAMSQLLNSLSYQGVLKRGFALVRSCDGAMVRSAGAVAIGAAVELEFHDGRVNAQVKSGSGPLEAQSADGTAQSDRPADRDAVPSNARKSDNKDTARLNPEGEPVRGRKARTRPRAPDQGSLF